MRRSGYALMGSGVLLVVATVVEYLGDLDLVPRETIEVLTVVLPLPPLFLLFLALPKVAVHGQGTSPTGGLGGIGFILTVIGLLMVIAAFLVVVAFPDEAETGEISYILGGALLLVGTLFFAAATRRAGVFPRGGALLLAIGWIGFWFSLAVEKPPLFFIPALCLFGAGWIWLGYMLAFERPRVLTAAEVAMREGHTVPLSAPPPPPPPSRNG